MKIAVVGNCQVHGIANILSTICIGVDCEAFHVSSKLIDESSDHFFRFEGYDLVLINQLTESKWQHLCYDNIKHRDNVVILPRIVFKGFHPDCNYLQSASGLINSPLGDYHSAIILCSFVQGLSEDQTVELFNPQFFDLLGYNKAYENNLLDLKLYLDNSGLDGARLVNRWSSKGVFMHTINHPKLFVLVDLVKAVCDKNGISFDESIDVEAYVIDNLLSNIVYPVYPGLGKRNRQYECLRFKKSVAASKRPSEFLTINQYVNQSFEHYKAQGSISSLVPASLIETFETAYRAFITSESLQFEHPYKRLPDYNYWSRSIAKKTCENVDPVIKFNMQISPSTKVATAGSCFAQHIARTLARSGMNYYVAENGSEALSSEERNKLGYGLFSARYGNIYTARQLLQLFDRAYGSFEPEETHWQSDDGRFFDPFRPNIGETFSSAEELKKDQISHLSCVREMFESLDVFVFTLGLTEAWENVIDGAVYPVAPGVVSHNVDKKQYRFINFDYSEVVSDLDRFLFRLRKVNPKANVILTVSPVPLVATKEDRHVLTSTTLSKSVLRAAADNITNTYSFVEYFPSFEIITGNFNRGKYFAQDLRSVLDDGVGHVMRLFMEHCIGDKPVTIPDNDENVVTQSSKEFEELSEVICDEELLEQ